VTFRLVATPLAGEVGEPVPRAGGLAPALLDALVPAPGLDSLRSRLAQPDVLVVTTGQQPALFTGPLYTVHKALSAAALAQALERRWRRPVVPVFWSAGDDHDWAEASHASWPVGETVRTVRLRMRAADAPLTPLWREPLGPAVQAAVDAFAADVHALPHGDAAIAWLARHFTPEHTVSAAAAGALAELLAPYGIACLDTTHPVVKRAAAPLLLRAAGESEALDRALVARRSELALAGVDAGVPVGDGATLVMLEGRAGRDRLMRADGAVVTRRGHERFSPGDLAALAEREPERLSPNVLLRPVLESALLPTVVYVAGPGELRYLELAAPLYQCLGVPRQLPVPRWSGVIVGAAVDRTLARFDAVVPELLEPPGALERRVLTPLLPPAAVGELAALRADAAARYAALTAVARGIDPTLVRTAEGALRRTLAQADRLEAKLLRATRRREKETMSALARARVAVAPLGRPQERVITVAAPLARHGSALLTALSEEMSAWYAGALEGRLAAS
jgi:bacillithiol biosynthesis cysteine-adding enzyme BshC